VEGLLTSGSPSQVLERAALLDAAGDHRSNVVDQVTVVRTQADAASGAAKQAVAKAATLKQQAATALAHAEQLEASARQQAQTVQAQQVTLQAQLQQAQQTLVSLTGQRAAYEIYQQQQSAAAAAAAAKAAAAARSATVSTPKRSTAAAPAPVSSAGSADGSAVETAIRAARRWIGTIYAWGGGSTTGPSVGWGVDKGVVGFDCSGLTRYAYAQAGITIPRNSSDQYMALPKVSLSNLQRGDLVFYAYDTSDPSTIHHVALYLGGNRMIEAPESGETIHETALRTGGLLGAVRPSA
jgi:cell wall-associated NlpC family hydrolase